MHSPRQRTPAALGTGPAAARAGWQRRCFLLRRGDYALQKPGEAAELLATRLAAYRGQQPLVLGVPRGAVPMARLISDALDGDLDVVLVRKLRAPGRRELAIGAVDESGNILKGSYFDLASDDYVREEVRTQMEILRMRRKLYTRARRAIDPAGRIAIIVDDGIATGSSMVSSGAGASLRSG